MRVSKILLLSCTFLTISCGNSDKIQRVTYTAVPGSTQIPIMIQPSQNTTSCPFGQFSIMGQTCTQGDFAYICRQNGGSITNVGGMDVCKTSLTMNPNGFSSYKYNGWLYLPSGLPRLSLSSPSNDSSLNVGFKLRKGDLFEISEVKNGWGSTETVLWDSLQITDADSCNQILADGVEPNSGTTVTTNDGQAAGFYGSDGTEAFLIGKGVTKVINNDGYLRMGFTIPPDVSSGCNSILFRALTITRCEDKVGRIYNCQNL